MAFANIQFERQCRLDREGQLKQFEQFKRMREREAVSSIPVNPTYYQLMAFANVQFERMP
jgi:hypothetical protein